MLVWQPGESSAALLILSVRGEPGVAQPQLEVVVEHDAVAQIASSAEVVVNAVKFNACGADNLERHGNDLMADSVSGDDSDSVTHNDSD